MSEPSILAFGFDGDELILELTSGQHASISVTVPGLDWLLRASPQQRAKGEIEPRGFAVYWPELDNGIEAIHVLQRRR